MTSPSPPKPHNTHPSLGRFSVIREWDIDLLLLEELNCCPDFSAWLYETIRRRVSRVSLPVIRPTMCVARHSVNNVGDGSGESDIEAYFHSGQGSQLPEALLLIEDKVNAQFTEGQPEGYAARCVEIGMRLHRRVRKNYLHPRKAL